MEGEGKAIKYRKEHSHPPLAARERGYVHEATTYVRYNIHARARRYAPPVVDDALLCAALGRLLLLLLFDLRGLRLDLTGARKRTVNYTRIFSVICLNIQRRDVPLPMLSALRTTTSRR